MHSPPATSSGADHTPGGDTVDAGGSPAAASSSRGRGRPSVKTERHQQIVRAFITLVADRGLEAVTLDDVARRAGVQRSVIRHYVGNRDALIHAAFAELKEWYDGRASATLGDEPDADAVVAYLFGDAYVGESEVEDRAFGALLVEAQRNPELASTIRRSYSTTIERIAAAASRVRPDRSPDECWHVGYQLLCLAEFNVDLQQLGFDPSSSAAAAVTARRILDG